MSSIVVGIDLGTTNTCVACYIDGRVRILENEEGGRITPSYIYLTEKGKTIVGCYAKKMANIQVEHGIYEIKRLIGRKFDDPYVQKNIEYFPFNISSVDNDPVVTIKRKDDEFTATPRQLCTAILKKIKSDAEAKLEEPIDKAVITVPAYFNNSQREATLSAANEAGFTVLKLLNEPTAAALSYYLEHENEKHYSLVYDLGGGTFDVSILKRSGNNLDIIGVDGDTHLGGHDLDNLILDYVCGYLKENFKYDPKSDRRTLRRLRNQCEEAKKMLSLAEETIIVLDEFVKDCPTVAIDLTRDQFEKMAEKLFQTTMDIVDNCLKNSNLAKTQIEEVILAGGSTRIPKIQKMISEYFCSKGLNKAVNPDECVAEGAAIQAAMFSTNKRQQIGVLKIRDVTPLSLGVDSLGDLMTICIKRNTPIPVSKTDIRVTTYNKQKTMTCNIYEGERKNAIKNRLLGKFTIEDITPAPPGQCSILITMTIDENGILKVKAQEELCDNVKDLTITYTRGYTSDKEVENALKDAEDNRLEDERFVRFAELKSFVIQYCEGAKYNFKTKGLEVLYEDKYTLCESTTLLAERLTLEDEEKLKELYDEIKKACDETVNRHNFKFMPVLEYSVDCGLRELRSEIGTEYVPDFEKLKF